MLTLAQGVNIVPIPGTKRRAHLEENWKALDMALSSEELAQLERESPAAKGDRYDPLRRVSSVLKGNSE